MKLHYDNRSSSSRRVSLVVAHLGFALEHRHLDLMRERAELGKLNPNVKIPVLEDGDFVLWESHAIMQYLCELTSEQTLWPRAPRARADVQRWLFWSSTHLAHALGGICFERMWKRVIGAGEPDQAQIARHTVLFDQLMTILDAHLARRTWVAGDELSLADFSIAAPFTYEQRAELPTAPYAHARAWLDRVRALPAWQQTEPSW